MSSTCLQNLASAYVRLFDIAPLPELLGFSNDEEWRTALVHKRIASFLLNTGQIESVRTSMFLRRARKSHLQHYPKSTKIYP